MNIPDEMLPQLAFTLNGQPKLPPMPNDWYFVISKMSPEDKARRYLEEACRTLALFKYWASQAE